jgi:formate dehydrogenase iron-sulfur subunit
MSEFSRRSFLKHLGAGAAAVAAAQVLAPRTLASETETAGEAEDTWAMLIDLTRCVGCNSCALACKEANNLPDAGTPPTELNHDTFTFVDEREVTTGIGISESRYVKRQCMHCLNAACVSACPAAAMYKSEAGPVVYRPERCLGCRYCQVACPFGVPSFAWDDGITPTISKCWLCAEKLADGEQPACANACPNGAIRFGKREALLAQAHAQIESNPHRYIDHVFGEHEVGGTSILYLSDVPFEELGFPENLPDSPIAEGTQKIMHALPSVIGGTTALMVGVALYTHRRHGQPALHQTQEKDHD